MLSLTDLNELNNSMANLLSELRQIFDKETNRERQDFYEISNYINRKEQLPDPQNQFNGL